MFLSGAKIAIRNYWNQPIPSLLLVLVLILSNAALTLLINDYHRPIHLILFTIAGNAIALAQASFLYSTRMKEFSLRKMYGASLLTIWSLILIQIMSIEIISSVFSFVLIEQYHSYVSEIVLKPFFISQYILILSSISSIMSLLLTLQFHFSNSTKTHFLK